MPRPKPFSIHRRSLPGAPPGTLIPSAGALAPEIDLLTYTEDRCSEQKNVGIEEIRAAHGQEGVTWVNIVGLGEAEALVQTASLFGLHHLALEDVLNVHQRPKLEEFDDHFFIVVRMIAAPGSMETEQVSIFLGEDFVLSIQEKPGDCFDAVRERVRKGRGIIRTRKADYLCYALIDSVVDAYFPTLETLGESLEQLEDAVVGNANARSIESIHDMKRSLLALRRSIWPHRELLNTLARGDHELISRDSQPYFRDCYDHTIQLIDIVETFREISSGLVDVYISSVSAKLNEIMKVLTIIATVFMPLGFLASLYGMNFDRTASAWNMPELGWRYGYPLSLGLMTACALGMVVYFWRKGWLDGRSRLRRRKDPGS